MSVDDQQNIEPKRENIIINSFFKTKKFIINTRVYLFFSTLIIFSAWVFLLYDYPQIIWNRFGGEKLSEIQGISLGDNKETVLYKMGKPQIQISELPCGSECKIFVLDEERVKKETPDIEEYSNVIIIDNDYDPKKNDYWGYGGLDTNVLVTFNKNDGLVYGIQCTDQCDPIFGIRIGDSENRVIRLLGKPAVTEIERGQKRMYYDRIADRPNDGFRIVLERGVVLGFELKK